MSFTHDGKIAPQEALNVFRLDESIIELAQFHGGVQEVWKRPDPDLGVIYQMLTDPISRDDEGELYDRKSVVVHRFPGAQFCLSSVNPQFYSDYHIREGFAGFTKIWIRS